MTRPVTPYSGLPDHCYWSRSHRGVAPGQIDPVVRGGFTLTPGMKIATAGSCFAQHIARHLQGQGYNYLVTEAAHPVISAEVARSFGYGVFTARYGNLYTARQLLQLARRARGEFTPAEDAWEDADGRLIDPFRPNVQPGGFASRAEFDRAREVHFEAVRRMMAEADVFVFTFGLTEGWRSRRDGAVFPLAPGVAGGAFDPEAHEFVNFTVAETVADFTEFVGLMREVNPGVRVLMTVSPVPLIATAREDESVIAATAYSKSVLRVACEELRTALPDCHYFPSYEVITGNYARGAYYGPDLREVEAAGVAHVMRLFMTHYTDAPPPEAPPAPVAAPVAAGTAAGEPGAAASAADRAAFKDRIARALEVVCDEEMIDRP